MKTTLVLMALAAGSPSGSSATEVQVKSLEAVFRELRPVVQTGTLLVSQGDCLAIRVYTQSPYTHVAAVVRRNGEPFVYDSANGAGARCLTLANYLKAQSPDEIHVFQPNRAFGSPRSASFEKHLDSQLGRPYAVQHHLTGENSEGIHCAEYVSAALRDCGVLSVDNPARVSPASLVTGITRYNVYSRGPTVRVTPEPLPEPPESSSWCERLWHETKTCTVNCFARSKRVLLCQ